MNNLIKTPLILVSLTLTAALYPLITAADPVVVHNTGNEKPNNSPFVVQTFNRDGLSIQFKYQGNDLKAIKVTNNNLKPMQVDLVNHSYVLGTQDYVIYDLPNIEYIDLAVGPYDGFTTWADKTLPNRFNDLTLYHLPAQKNRSTEYADFLATPKK